MRDAVTETMTAGTGVSIVRWIGDLLTRPGTEQERMEQPLAGRLLHVLSDSTYWTD